MKTYLNLGCGMRYHPAWTNVDMVANHQDIIEHNLLENIPFTENHFEVVYHSHVLEHFNKADGERFIKECFRVLKRGGIFRIAVPNLEQIARLYLSNLEKALEGDLEAEHNYNWMLLEMYDQTVRNHSGGEMAAYFFQETIPNENFVFERIGEEGRNIRKHVLESRNKEQKSINQLSSERYKETLKGSIKNIFRPIKAILKNTLFSYEI